MERTAYGATVTKLYKTFLATYLSVGSVIRVVLVNEDHGWPAFFCTDGNATVQKILEAFADLEPRLNKTSTMSNRSRGLDNNNCIAPGPSWRQPHSPTSIHIAILSLFLSYFNVHLSLVVNLGRLSRATPHLPHRDQSRAADRFALGETSMTL